MSKVTKYLAAVFVAALLGAMLVGCSGQQAASSASASSSAAAEQTPDELIAELDAISKESEQYKSVTMDMTGTIKMDLSAMFSVEDESGAASDASASAEAAASSDAAEASGEAAEADDSSVMEMPINTHAECDISDGTVNMHLNMNFFGADYEMYIKGENAILVINGEVASATLEELGMEQYASVDSIMKSQMGDMDLASMKDGIKSIEKSTEGDETVYKLVIDPKTFATSNEQLQSMSQMGADSLGDVNVTYHVNADGKVSAIDLSMSGMGFSSDIKVALTDYDSTVVAVAPEATMTYSELQEKMGADVEALEQAADGDVLSDQAVEKAA